MPQFSSSSPPPWTDPPFEAKFFKLSKSKAKENPAMGKGLFASICACLPHTALSVYTDGLFLPDVNSTADGFCIPKLQFKSSFYFVRDSCVFSDELYTIKEALNFVYSFDTNHGEIWVFTDSEASIKSLLVASVKHQ